MFIKFEKKVFIDSSCVSPMPSKSAKLFNNLSLVIDSNNLLNSFTEVTRRYPDSDYAKDAQLKIDLTRDHLAGKEMYIGRYYMKQSAFLAAINRFRYVVTEYQNTSHTPEALHRIVEGYISLGLINEAKATAAVLGYNFPDSEWYESTYDLINDFLQ